MTELPKIRAFTGQVPNKEVMDKDTFANSVHTYLNYFNDTFVPDTQDFVDKAIQWNDELDTYKTDIENIKNEADTIKTDVENYKNLAKDYANADKDVEVESGFYSAKNFALYSKDYMESAKNYQILAKDYANADEDVEVESGFYSAKHWSIKAKKIVDGAVAELPEGTIDDEVIADDKTWSSSKLDEEFKKVATAGNIDGGNASSSADAIIDGGGAS